MSAREVDRGVQYTSLQIQFIAVFCPMLRVEDLMLAFSLFRVSHKHKEIYLLFVYLFSILSYILFFFFFLEPLSYILIRHGVPHRIGILYNIG